MAKNDKPTYSEAIAQLEEILRKFEDGSLDVDTLAAEVKRATELISFCRTRLRATEEEVASILNTDKAGGEN